MGIFKKILLFIKYEKNAAKTVERRLEWDKWHFSEKSLKNLTIHRIGEESCFS